MEARVSFTKETREQLEKGLTRRQAGKLRFKRLKEHDDEGRLSAAKNRWDLASMVGLGGVKAGYAWVSNLINRGHITETLLGTAPNGKLEYEYHIVREPSYNTHKVASPKVENKVSVAKVEATADKTKMVIKYKELVIEIDNVSEAMVTSVITKLIDN